MKQSSRLTLAACAVLTALILWATGLLTVRLKPYCVARWCGREANLRGVSLPLAPLCGAQLQSANLEGANLRGADLRQAKLKCACLNDADLRGADLRGAELIYTGLLRADLRGADLRGIKLGTCGNGVLWEAKGALYDDQTRWDKDYCVEFWGAEHIQTQPATAD